MVPCVSGREPVLVNIMARVRVQVLVTISRHVAVYYVVILVCEHARDSAGSSIFEV